MKTIRFDLAVDRIEEELGQSNPDTLPSLIGELERLKALAQAKLCGQPINGVASPDNDEC